jgi:hypothetical protein
MSFDSILAAYLGIGFVSMPWIITAMALYAGRGELIPGFTRMINDHSNVEILIGFIVILTMWPLVVYGTVKGLITGFSAKKESKEQED